MYESSQKPSGIDAGVLKDELRGLKLKELTEIAESIDCKRKTGLNKDQFVEMIVSQVEEDLKKAIESKPLGDILSKTGIISKPQEIQVEDNADSNEKESAETGVADEQFSGARKNHHSHTNRAKNEKTGFNAERMKQKKFVPRRENDRNNGEHRVVEVHDRKNAEEKPPQFAKGILDIMNDEYGFMRTNGYFPAESDIYVSKSQIRRFSLMKGDELEGQIRPPKQGEKYHALLRIEKVNGKEPDQMRSRKPFESLVPLYPLERLRLEIAPETMEQRRQNYGEAESWINTTRRVIDIMAPIGKGQRGLIVSPPRAGKTIILKEIANSIKTNNPESYLIVLLIDERPEEVTDMERSVMPWPAEDGKMGKRMEVISSTFDRPSDNHTQVAELVLERAKRLVELGEDVIILLDSITRLARAYNLNAPTSGRILSGGVDSCALYPPKRFFGSARNIEEGGSLTIIATALVDTGSKMDEVIFEEFKGTGNMELHLDRRLADRRVFPAIEIGKSGTRRDELILEDWEREEVWKLRKILHALEPAEAIELLIEKIRKTRSNNKFFDEVKSYNSS